MLTNDLPLKFDFCRRVKQQLPANGPALAKYVGISIPSSQVCDFGKETKLPGQPKGASRTRSVAKNCWRIRFKSGPELMFGNGLKLKFGCQAPYFANALLGAVAA